MHKTTLVSISDIGQPMIVTEQLLNTAKTTKGGYTQEQIKMAQLFCIKNKWHQELIGKNVTDEWWNRFVTLSNKKNRKVKSKVINSVSVKKDWAWKPDKTDIPSIKTVGKKKGKKRKIRNKVSRYDNSEFYTSKEWRQLRVRVLEKYECKCMMCGRSPKLHNIVIHVDHIKPRSKFPKLSLDFNNLQLLCEDCNMGKSNKYETDYRPEMDIVLNAIDKI